MRSSVRGAVVALAVTLTGAKGRAQPSGREELARRQLIEQAEQARRSGNHARVVELGERAAQIRQTPSLRLMLATAHGELGHVVSALAEAQSCVREAEIDAALRQRESILAGCRELVERFEGRVGYVTLRAEGGAPEGMTLRVNGDGVNTALLGTPVPVSPGEVRVEAEAPGRERFTRTVRVRAGRREEVTLRLGAAATATSGEGVSRPALATGGGTTGGGGGGGETSSGPGAGPWVVMGIGAAVGIAGGVLLGVAEGHASDLQRNCPNGECVDQAAVEANRGTLDAAQWMRPVGGALLGVGGAALVGGLIWRLVAPGGGSREQRVSVTAGIGQGGAGVGLRGYW